MVTYDQHQGLYDLNSWYRRYKDQVIEISGVVGTGVWDLLQEFISHTQLSQYEVMYLTYDQKQLLDMASKKYHTFYTDAIAFKYIKEYDYNTLKVINPRATKTDIIWHKVHRSKIDSRYKLIVIMDSLMLDKDTMTSILDFGVPVVLLRDPMLLAPENSYTFNKPPTIILNDVNPNYIRYPITHFCHKILRGDRILPGNYDIVSVVNKRDMNMSNLRTNDMNIVMNDQLRIDINNMYRDRILRSNSIINTVGERVVVTETLHGRKLVNDKEKKIKLYLTEGTIGTITKLNKHAMGTKWVPCEFTPDYYHEQYTDLVLNRHVLNGLDIPSSQLIPDEDFKCEYAYAITPDIGRCTHWDSATVIMSESEEMHPSLYTKLLYMAFSKTRKKLTIII